MRLFKFILFLFFVFFVMICNFVKMQVWKSFNCKTLEEYLLLYLKTDVLLLGCVFEAFRETALQQYGLDPAHFVSGPHLSFDAMLKFTGAQIEVSFSAHRFYNFIFTILFLKEVVLAEYIH